MRVFKLFLIGMAVLTGLALMKSDPNNRRVIYDSLDTLAEIFTLTRQYAPAGVSDEQLVEGAINGLLDQLDPHSNYYNTDRYRTLKENQQGSFFGIGIIVGYQNNQLTVVSPLEDTPAGRAGVRAGDVIQKINGTETANLDMYEAIRLLRGVEGSTVSVTLLRTGMDEPLELELERAQIPTNNVRHAFMLDKNTGYVALKDFGENATTELSTAIGDLEAGGMKQLILDLRGNPGGLLPEAISVASLFIPGTKLVVYTKGRIQSANQEYFSEPESPISTQPLIVLIDRGSASASEIIAGAIQDHDRGLILGVNSWGKGLVQSVFPVSEGSKGLALTTARYYTPSGRNIQGDYHSLEAYYNPKSSEKLYFEDSSNSPHSPYRTVNGREVLEVRGITPDVYIPFPVIPAFVQDLETKYDAFFNFAALNQDKYGKIGEDWRISESGLNEFKAYLAEHKIPCGDFNAERELIGEKLTYHFLYINHAKWAWKYLIQTDHQVKVSLGAFDKAGQLLQVFLGKEKLPQDYGVALKQYARLNHPDQIADNHPSQLLDLPQ